MIERAYAKINLALEVLPTREDGYHEVRNLMVPIDLYDKLHFEVIDEGIEVISDIDIKNNFVTKAAQLFFETYNINKGIRITLEKRIPISAGLAGGSSDAAACLRGLNKIFKVNASLDELAKLSETLGSDMPYCVYSRPSICYGRGEIVKVLDDLEFDDIPLTLIRFKFGLSTKAVYQEYEYKEKNRNKEIENIIIGLKNNDIDLLNNNIFNDLERPAHSLNEYLNITTNHIKELGLAVHQSGSGPTHYILKRNISKKIYKACDKIKLYQTHILCNPNKIKKPKF